MRLVIEYVSQGILFRIEGGSTTEFPLNQAFRKKIAVAEWTRLNAVEQLWYQNFLEYLPHEGQYLLPTHCYFEIDQETKDILGIPRENARIAIRERGHLGSSRYSIEWFLLHGSRQLGRIVRQGNIVSSGDYRYALTPEQFRLVAQLDAFVDDRTTEGRGRFHAQITQMARMVGAKMDDFTARRDFVFADTADYELIAISPQEIRFKPILKDVPEHLVDALPAKLADTTDILADGRRSRIYASELAKSNYNMIADISPIMESQVPRFLENPLELLPECFDDYADEFSERVKGLKIRTSTAVPYLHIQEDTQRPGWFDVETGITLQSEQEDAQEETLEYTDEFSALVDAAKQNSEPYVYYQSQWIKINPDGCKNWEDIQAVLQDEHEGKVTDRQRRLILDIYENIGTLEYGSEKGRVSYNDSKMFAVPQYFNGVLRQHQLEGYSFLRAHHATQIGVLLADDMGLGKTVQIISFLSYLFASDTLPTALLVMPKSILENWVSELKRFLPVVTNIYIHQGAQRYQSHEMIAIYDIVLTTYETLARDQTILGRIPWSCIVCDEVQKIKNFKTLAANAVKGMNSSCRIAMTGTPVENRLSELWSIADFVQPGLLGSYQSFRSTYEKPIQEGVDAEISTEALVHTLSPIFLRRMKENVLSGELPIKSESSIHLSFNRLSERYYLDIIDEYRLSTKKGMALATIQKLIMLCSHPALVIKRTYSTRELLDCSEKLKWVIETLRQIKKKQEKAIIFTRYVEMQGILRYVIGDYFNVDARIINGAMTENRQSVIDLFSAESGFSVLILSPKAAGVGLNIVAANHVIHYTREWNPAVENQATDRVYRIGQERPVQVYYPVMVSNHFLSVEEKIAQLLSDKRELMRRVVVPSNLELSEDDFGDVLEI